MKIAISGCLSIFVCALYITVCGQSVFGAEISRAAAPGQYMMKADQNQLSKVSFSSKQPLIATYLFYWYDYETREGFYDGEGKDLLTHHPAERKGYSYNNPDWYYRELKDMASAGIDIVLPVYWGYPNFTDNWSFKGLLHLVAALDRLEAEGAAYPKIGLFYGCAGLKLNHFGFEADLTKPDGKEWLYISIRDFYSFIPSKYWACIDNMPAIWLYTNEYSPKYNDSSFEYVKDEFDKDFGTKPYIVKEMTWTAKTDSAYAWGAAINGPTDFGVISVGPGFDTSGIGGKIYRKRDKSNFYRKSWDFILSKPLKHRSELAVIETWNELFEGTDICDTEEFGREYIKITRTYADRFHKDEVISDHNLRSTASVSLGKENISDGLIQNESTEGITKPVTINGRSARQTVKNNYSGRYIYFDADIFILRGWGTEAEVNVTYLDKGEGGFSLEYDSMDIKMPYNGAFKTAGVIKKTDTGEWKSARFILPEPAFSNRTHVNDFRLYDISNDLVVSDVSISVKNKK